MTHPAAWAFIAPALIVIGVFFLVPVAAGFALSLTDFDIYALADFRNLRFVGLDNYVRMLETPLFWQALGNTLYFVIVGVPLSIGLSLAAEYAGALGPLVGASRRFDGPMGKSDRAFVFGVLGLWASLAAALPSWLAVAMPLMAVALVVTIVNRVRGGLAERSRNDATR